MKILLLNPQIDAAHELIADLRPLGVSVLLPEDEVEAWQMLQLHGNSVELAVVHREGLASSLASKEFGIKFIEKVKADPNQSDLPIILTSQEWGNSEFAAHQNSSQGVNAYLKFPFSLGQLTDLFDGVLGSEWRPSNAVGAGTATTPIADGQYPEVPFTNTGIVLEDASKHFGTPTPSDISLSAPPAGEVTSPSIPTVMNVGAPPPDFAPLKDVEAVDISKVDIPRPSGSKPPKPPGKEEGFVPTSISILMAKPGDDEGKEPNTSINVSPDEPSVKEPRLAALLGSLLGRNKKKASGADNVEEEEKSTPAIESEKESDSESDAMIAREMPYLAPKAPETPLGLSETIKEKKPTETKEIHLVAVGDAVVPGGAAQTPDEDTLKKYLMLREQDVVALSTQLKRAKDQVHNIENDLQREKALGRELNHQIDELKKKLENFERDKAYAMETLTVESGELRFQLKAKSDKVRILENRVKEINENIEQLKERVRIDIRRIRVREKELENRLEIVKKDSEALISSRENKILELKRKIDLLEFNMDLLQDQYAREKNLTAELRDRLTKAAQVVRVAEGVLEPEPNSETSSNTGSGPDKYSDKAVS